MTAQKEKKTTESVAVGQVRDQNGRTVFKDPILCAQFLRDNVDLPLLKNIRTEDISDVTEKYRGKYSGNIVRISPIR